jgi:hypothetical protein
MMGKHSRRSVAQCGDARARELDKVPPPLAAGIASPETSMCAQREVGGDTKRNLRES